MQEFLQFVIQHWLLWVGLIVVVLLILRMEMSPTVGGVRLLTPQQITDYINHKQAVVLDIRDKSAFDEGHISGAIHFSAAEVEKQVKKIQKYKKKPIIVMCINDQHSPKLASKRVKHGFEQVFSSKGGVNTWRKASLPLIQ